MRTIKNLTEITSTLAGGKYLAFHASVSEPAIIGEQLIEGAKLWPGLRVETFMPAQACPYLADADIEVATVMPGAKLRDAVNTGRVKLIRESLYDQSQAFHQNRRRADIVVLHVSQPDHNGQVSLGPSCGIVPQLLAQKPFVIAVVNAHVPRTDFNLPIGQFDVVMEHDSPLPDMERAAIDPVDEKIADLVAGQLSNGITVEIGMGSTPDAIMQALTSLRNLKIHTGLINDTIIPVINAGATSEPVTTTMALGSTKFYQWMDDNPALNFRPIIETHDPKLLSKLPRFYTINAAIQVDLDGNVNAERIGERIISCPGGLPDFTAGARGSEGGCNIIVLRSTAGRRQKSTIVNRLDFKTLDGSYVDMIVTEYGVANLRGLNRQQRARAISAIAHPQEQDLRI